MVCWTRMTNWGVTKTNNDRNLFRYNHTYSNPYTMVDLYLSRSQLISKQIGLNTCGDSAIFFRLRCRKSQSKTETEHSTIHYASVFN